jgi:hypothetical protein
MTTLAELYKQEEELYKAKKYKDSSDILIQINKLLKSQGVKL